MISEVLPVEYQDEPICPNCASEDVFITSHLHANDGILWADMHCMSCEFDWTQCSETMSAFRFKDSEAGSEQSS